MEERPKRDGRLRSSTRPGNSLRLLEGERPEALAEGRIVLLAAVRALVSTPDKLATLDHALVDGWRRL
jgi:hypothetical protein